MSVVRTDVAEQQERDEGQPGQGQEEGDEGPGPGGARPLGEARHDPAQQVTQVEDKESSHGNKIFLPALLGEKFRKYSVNKKYFLKSPEASPRYWWLSLRG